MSGECDYCGQTDHVELEHCCFKDYVGQLQDEVNDLMDENAKLRRLCVDAAELLHMSGEARDWLVKCMRLQARLEEACDV